MSGTAQRVSRGFQRLALFLAAIPLLVGVIISVAKGLHEADSALTQHEKLLCANRSVLRSDRDLADNPFWTETSTPDERLQLKVIGCSDWEGDTVSFQEARNPPEFNWLSTLARETAPALAITLVIALAIYGVVRAIGWVIGGFAAS
jgi:hypothetical protein